MISEMETWPRGFLEVPFEVHKLLNLRKQFVPQRVPIFFEAELSEMGFLTMN